MSNTHFVDIFNQIVFTRKEKTCMGGEETLKGGGRIVLRARGSVILKARSWVVIRRRGPCS